MKEPFSIMSLSKIMLVISNINELRTEKDFK